jgi:fructose-1,6-bisphosphatase/inositol monophosphatase family enzyme
MVNSLLEEQSALTILEKMREIALVAGGIIQAGRSEILSTGETQIKDDLAKRDHVTKYDKMSEKAISDFLKLHFPGAMLIGEEDGRFFPNAPTEDLFLFDPLDGTGIYSGKVKEDLRKSRVIDDLLDLNISPMEGDFNKYGVFISFLEKNQPIAEFCYSPETQEQWFAVKGFGSFYRVGNDEPQKVFVSARRSLSDAVAGYGFLRTVFSEEYMEKYKGFIESMRKFPVARCYGFTGAIYEACATTLPSRHRMARDLYLNPQIYAWDHPSLLLQEAGGSSVIVMEKGGRLEIKPFSYSQFEFSNPQSDAFKQPYAIVTGSPWIVDKFVKMLEHRLK